jgi:hypothetical protein
MKTEFDNTENEALNKTDVSGSFFERFFKNNKELIKRYSEGDYSDLEKEMLKHKNFNISDLPKVSTISIECFQELLKMENLDRPVRLCYNFHTGELKIIVL